MATSINKTVDKLEAFDSFVGNLRRKQLNWSYFIIDVFTYWYGRYHNYRRGKTVVELLKALAS